jgi:hypothetical protein
MALNKLNINCTVDDLMQKARDMKFTKSGEIFDGKILSNLFGKI